MTMALNNCQKTLILLHYESEYQTVEVGTNYVYDFRKRFCESSIVNRHSGFGSPAFEKEEQMDLVVQSLRRKCNLTVTDIDSDTKIL